jgi:flagellar export protein FliJ
VRTAGFFVSKEMHMKEQTIELVAQLRETELAHASGQLERIARLVREVNQAIEQARKNLRTHDDFLRDRTQQGMTASELMSARRQREALEDELESLQGRLDELHRARSEAVESQREAARRFQRHQSLRERHAAARASERQTADQRRIDERAGYQSWLESNTGGGTW